jgi:hypothetical protein
MTELGGICNVLEKGTGEFSKALIQVLQGKKGENTET